MDNIQDIYPLTPMQEGMLFHSIYAPESEVYQEQFSCTLIGELNVVAFKLAWEKVIERHDILRTAFIWEDVDEPLQVVHEIVELPFEYLEFNRTDESDKDILIKNKLQENHRKTINFNEAPLMRITLIKLDDQEHIMIWDHHHILFDGWGLPLLMQEIIEIYEANNSDKFIELHTPNSYKNYIAWLQEQDEDRAKLFWEERLKNISKPTVLSFPFANDLVEGYAIEKLVFSSELSERVKQLTKTEQLTINTLFQSVWALILSYYTGEKNVVFGATVSGRNADVPGIETMIGLFINTLPVCAEIDSNKLVIEWLKKFQLDQSELQTYEYTPLFKIQQWTNIQKGEALFNSIFIFENYPVSETLEESNSSFKISNVNSIEKTNYPLTIVVSPGKNLGIEIAFDTKLFNNENVKELLERFQTVLINLLENTKKKIKDIKFVNEDEIDSLIKISCGSKNEVSHQSVISWFYQIVEEKPEQVAIVSDAKSLTYNELNRLSNQYAQVLSEKNITRGSIVGVMVERSVEMVTAVMAVLKTGASFLPIDNSYPLERIKYLINDSSMDLLISSEDNITDSIFTKSLISLENLISTSSKEKEDNIFSEISGKDLCYIIYTSGSTGKPKGVCLEHESVCNYASYTIRDFNYTKNENILQFSSFGFDGAVGEIFSSLLSGGTLFIPKREVTLSPEDLAEYINVNNITFAYLPPSFLSVINPDQFNKVLKIASIGDKCSFDLADNWGEKYQFFNGYGPTETTIGATYLKFNSNLPKLPTMPIGKGFGNVNIYVLNEMLIPVSIGVLGEIYISGNGVGRGYLNNPDATAEKFIPNPYSYSSGNRMYKTGDLARILPDGNVEFMGRADNQVKLRGFRIEINEIEAILNEHLDVKTSAVKAIKGSSGNEYLAGYIIPNTENVNVKNILDFLREELPEYMVPKNITILDEFPLTPNRKVDKDNLPNPETDQYIEEYVEPRTTTEEIVSNIWSDILKIDKVSRNSNFFELGGHSLLATQLISRLRETFKKEIPFPIIFESKDLKEISIKIDNINHDSSVNENLITKMDRTEDIPLSYSQKRLWFLDKLKPGDVSYNIPTIFRLKGNINTNYFEESFNHIIRKHEVLRTVFIEKNGKPFQNIYEEFNLKIDIKEIDGNSIEEKIKSAEFLIIEKIAIPFNLSELPLIKCEIFKLADDEIILFVLAHHIISDGWSVAIMMKEFISNYSCLSRDENIELEKMDIQFADYAKYQQNIFNSEEYKNQLNYWKANLVGAPPLLELPYDKPKPKVQSTRCEKVNLNIDLNLVERLNKITRSENATLFMTMMAGFQILLSKYSNQNDIVVGTPIAGRNNAQIENLIGFFVNNLAIRGKIDVKETFREFLVQIRNTTLSAYTNQSLPFDKLVEEIQPQRDLSHQPIFQVMFVFQNIPISSGGIGDLEIIPFDIESATTSFDLTLTLNQHNNGISILFEYNSDLFEYSTIERFASQYEILLEQISHNPDIDIEDISIVSESEEKLILQKYNYGSNQFKVGNNVIERFESVVQNYTDDEALVFDAMNNENTVRLSYGILNKKINQLARYLLSNNISNEDIVAICMERNIDMIVSMLAIMKTGAAFLPIDPSLPIDRIEYMINNSGCKSIIQNNSSIDSIKNLKLNLINLDQIINELEVINDSNLNMEIDHDNLAYIIYTSGSTGLPKGVMLSHKGLVNLSQVQKEAFDISNNKRIMQFSSLSFDASVWETVMALLNGGSLYLTSKQIISSGIDLHKYLSKNEITTVTLPPSVLAVLPKDELPKLKTLITAGEAVPKELVKEWNIEREYFNAYGPTETTVCATMYKVKADFPKGPPIGNAINNFETYILDPQLNIVGIGIPGELCVGGIGLARGYKNKPELTAEKFIPNRYSTKDGERLYRTGDLAKFLPDGEIEYLGRIDTQVKIRGFRIEVGEIENTLKQIDSIKDAAVVAKTSGDLKDKIIGYVVCGKEQYNKDEIVSSLQNKLPDYMIPNIIVRLDYLPLNTSGKVNKQELPMPKYSREEIDTVYVAPKSEEEIKLVNIVQELLKLDKVGIKDNFFELGGHSLLATQFVSRIRDEFGVEIKLIKLFEFPTIEGVLKNIKETESEPKIERPTITRVSRDSKRQRRTDLS